MSLFSSAIQTLSSMAINEAGIDIPDKLHTDDVSQINQYLINAPALTVNEMVYPAEAVLIRKCDRLGRYLIEAEDLSRYMITNQIHDARQAVNNILEAAGIPGQFLNVGLVIDEASLLEEIEPIGYAVTDNTLKTPPKGLGLGMVTSGQDEFGKFRRIANTKQLMDVLTGRYGLPLIKKNYKQQGLLEASEDVQLKKKPDEEIIHEEDDDKASKKDKAYWKKRKEEDPECSEEEGCECDTCKEEEKAKGKKPKKSDDKKKKECGCDDDETCPACEPDDDKEAVEESSGLDYENMSAHDLHIQRLRDIAAGKYDDEW